MKEIFPAEMNNQEAYWNGQSGKETSQVHEKKENVTLYCYNTVKITSN